MTVFNFERTAASNGFFRPKAITYTVTDAQERILLKVMIDNRNARVEGRSEADCFDLQKSFWGNAWNYVTSDMKHSFVRFSQGWHSNVILSDDRSYQMKIGRKWWILQTSDIPGYLQAAFRYNDELVMVLDNFRERAWTESESAYPMQGTITTSLTDIRDIAAMLLALQYKIQLQNHSSGAA